MLALIYSMLALICSMHYLHRDEVTRRIVSMGGQDRIGRNGLRKCKLDCASQSNRQATICDALERQPLF